MGTSPVSRGPVSTAVAANVRAVRERRGVSQQGLASELGRLGRPTQSSAIAKIEAGDRRVDVDDLVALAVALNVSPARLLASDDHGDQDARVHLAPGVDVPSWRAWQWLLGEHSLYVDDTDLNNPRVQAHELAWRQEQPLWRRVKADHALSTAVRHLSWAADGLLRVVPSAGGKPVPVEGVKSVAARARRAMRGVVSELDQAEAEASDV